MSQVTWTAVAGKLVHRAVLAPLGRQRSLVARRRGRAPLYEWRHVVYWAERMQAILDDWEDPAAQAEMVDIVDAGGPDWSRLADDIHLLSDTHREQVASSLVPLSEMAVSHLLAQADAEEWEWAESERVLYSSSFSHKRIDVLAWRPADKTLIAVDLKTRFSAPVTQVRESETAGLQAVHRLAVEQLLRVDGLPAQRLESWLFLVDAERVAWFGQDDLGGELVTERCPS